MTDHDGCAAEDVLLRMAGHIADPAPRLEVARERIATLAALLPRPTDDPRTDLAAVAALMRDRFSAAPHCAPLLLHEALRDGYAHPLCAAGAALCVAQRAGIAIDLVGAGGSVWLAHASGVPLIVDPAAPGAPFDGRTLGLDLHWRCAHQLAALTLGHLTLLARRRGDLALAVRVLRAQGALPLRQGAPSAELAHLN